MKVVVIEDEKSIIDAINIAFEFRWPDVVLRAARTGKEGIELVKKESPEVVILDINLPDIDGFEVLNKLREFSNTPVIILTVRAENEDVLRGLESGADDYVIKPFDYLTLLARVRAVLRRSEPASLASNSGNAVVSSRLHIDFGKQKVRVDDRIVALTPREYRLLVLLAKNKNSVVPYQRINQEIWEKELFADTKNIRLYVRRLRNKLQDNPPNMIINKHGVGYMFKS